MSNQRSSILLLWQKTWKLYLFIMLASTLSLIKSKNSFKYLKNEFNLELEWFKAKDGS